MDKKLIDKIRDSAGSMVVGTSDDQSAITTFLTLGKSLYAIKEKGIYSIKLADEIDPARTNPALPAVQQRIVALGSDSPLVWQTLLTAKALFSDQVLPKWFDCTKATLGSLEALKDLAAVSALKDSFVETEESAIAAAATQTGGKGSLILPAIADVDARCKTFFQKADHSSRSLLNIVKLFYKKLGVKGVDDVIQFAKKEYGETDRLVEYLEIVAPTLKYVRNVRNCLEHPNPPAMEARISDFSLGADGVIVRPGLEAIARSEHYPRMDISAVMTHLSDALPQIFEGVVAGLCEKHIQSMSGFQTFLIQREEAQRGQDGKHVRFSYGIKIGDQIAPLG